jgi:hypothetical protein
MQISRCDRGSPSLSTRGKIKGHRDLEARKGGSPIEELGCEERER